MINNIKTAINQYITIRKLKKEAKTLYKVQLQFSLIEYQHLIAKHYGYLHWHDLKSSVKHNILKL